MNELFGSPEERQRAFERAMEDYNRAFAETTNALTGHTIIGGIDAYTSMNWASKVPGAIGYLPEPELERAGFFEKLLRTVGSIASQIGGAKLGSWGGGKLSGWLKGGGGGSVVTAGSGAEGSTIAIAQHGAHVRAPTLALIGEAGEEAVVPLRNHAIPMSAGRNGLEVRLPSGDVIPVAFPAFALGGVVGAPSASIGAGMPALSSGASVYHQGPQGSRPVSIVYNIQTPDAQSFRKSQGQLMSEAVLAAKRAERRDL